MPWPPPLARRLPQQTIERQLSRGEEHRYQLSLDAGECARVVVEQQGIDVVVSVRRPEQAAPIVEGQDARMLRTAAAQRADLDDFAGAATLLEQALTLTEHFPESNDREVADVAAQLADVYLDKRDTARAEPLYLRALAI